MGQDVEKLQELIDQHDRIVRNMIIRRRPF